jgi:hypothetical protein
LPGNENETEAIVKSAVARGRDFETEVAQILRVAGFDVTINAKSAKPRQTDLFAKGDEIDFLVEAKNQKRRVEVGDIDDLRSRLRRTSSDIVGVIFTTSRLTEGAIEAIEADRSREVLAFIKEEIEEIISGNQNFGNLIERKRNELRVNGKAWFSSGVQSEFVSTKLPLSSVEFPIGGAARLNFESRSAFAGIFYSLQVPDTGWGVISGEGARLSIQLSLTTVRDLRNIVGYVYQKLGISGNGTFSIQQSITCWHGIGLENFLREIEQWRDRYSQSPSDTFHHSEELNYFDQFRNGWIELSSQQRVDWPPQRGLDTFLHHSQLTIQLSGVPVDTSPFLKLCRYTGNNWANFEYISEKMTFIRRLKKPLALKVAGTVVNKEPSPENKFGQEHVVIGIIARNPFYRKKSVPPELQGPELSALHGLTKTELLLCSLRDWYDDSIAVEGHKLQGFETTISGAGLIVRPFGTWDRVLKA